MSIQTHVFFLFRCGCVVCCLWKQKRIHIHSSVVLWTCQEDIRIKEIIFFPTSIPGSTHIIHHWLYILILRFNFMNLLSDVTRHTRARVCVRVLQGFVLKTLITNQLQKRVTNTNRSYWSSPNLSLWCKVLEFHILYV